MNSHIKNKAVIYSHSVEKTIRIGNLLTQFLKEGDCIALIGTYGCGKTTFVKGVAQGLNIKNWNKEVKSPSFVIMNIYKGDKTIYHFDAYRLKNFNDFFDLGIDEEIEKGIIVIEWEDRIRSSFHKPTWCIYFEHRGHDSRILHFVEAPENYLSFLQKMNHPA